MAFFLPGSTFLARCFDEYDKLGGHRQWHLAMPGSRSDSTGIEIPIMSAMG